MKKFSKKVSNKFSCAIFEKGFEKKLGTKAAVSIFYLLFEIIFL